MLSGHERRVLDAIEKQLRADDPQLCRALAMGHSATARRWKLGACVGGIVLGALTVSTGVLLLSLGLVIFGCLIGSIGVLAFVRVRNHRVIEGGRIDHRDPGGDVTPTWWSSA